jgi:hypothetical protein
MRKIASALLALTCGSLCVWACSSDNGVVANTADASDGTAAEAGPDGSRPPTGPDGSVVACKLENGGDPVALCTQKVVLKAQRLGGFAAEAGVFASWDSKTFLPDTNDAGATLRDFHDDLGFGAAISNYHFASGLYGDNEITATLDDTLVSLATVIESELPAPPAEYDGDVYARLRAIAAGLRYINENEHAAKIDAIAEPYARAIFSTYYLPVTGIDGGASASVIGTPSGNGQVAYEPAKVATAALALIQMAARHQGDDAANALKWETAASRALDYLWLRARDPVTHLYYASLVTSGDAGHDALATSPMPNDALYTEVQAHVMLTLLRAHALVRVGTDGGALSGLASYPFTAHVEDLLASMNNGIGLWDAVGQGFFEGYVPSTMSLLTNKPTAANALMFGAIHRKFFDDPPFDAGPESTEVVELKAIRKLLLDRTPENSSLFSVVTNQEAYLRASSPDFHLALLPGDAGTEPRAASYQSAAIALTLEGLNEQLYGYVKP